MPVVVTGSPVLSAGNCHLLMRLKGASGDEALVAPPVADSGMVQFRGSLLDVGSVMQQLERSEGTRTAVEARLKEIQQQLGEGAGGEGEEGAGRRDGRGHARRWRHG